MCVWPKCVRTLNPDKVTVRDSNEDFVRKHNLNMTKLPKSILVFNADGSSNVVGRLTHTIQLQVIIGDHKEIMEFGVSNLGTSDIFLGHDWLKHHNPEIDWKKKQFNSTAAQELVTKKK